MVTIFAEFFAFFAVLSVVLGFLYGLALLLVLHELIIIDNK